MSEPLRLSKARLVREAAALARHHELDREHARDGATNESKRETLETGMVRRWVAMGLLTAQKRFRRIKGHRDLPQLIAALRSQASAENVGMSRKCAKSGRPLRRRVSRSSFLGDPGASFSSGALAHSTEARFYEKGGRESC